jgi:hypothetical protein
VRAEAVIRLADQSQVESIARNDPAPLVRKTAVEKIGEGRLLAEIALGDPSAIVRAAATARLEEQALLQKIARTDRDWNVRLMALQRINQQPVIAELVKAESSEFVREAGARLLSDEAMLQSIASRGLPRASSSGQQASDLAIIRGRLRTSDGSLRAGLTVYLVPFGGAEPLPGAGLGALPPHGTTVRDGSFRIELDAASVPMQQVWTLAVEAKGELVPTFRNEARLKFTLDPDLRQLNIGTVTAELLPKAGPADGQ